MEIRIEEPRARKSLWRVVPRLLEVVVVVVILLAAAVDVVTLALASSPWSGYVAPLIIVAGVALSYRLAWAGLVLVAVAPAVATLSDIAPVAPWSMVCFAALLLTLRGLPALAVGGLLGVANFVSVGLTLGTVDVAVDASASVFAFAALMGAASGSAVRGNARYRQEVEHRIHDGEVARLTAVDRSVAQERVRIARDLHDSVGHQIAVVNMHLGAAEVFLDDDRERSRQSLGAAREAVQGVLRETQQILAILRVDRPEQRLEATPGHELIRQLIESYRTGGMIIEGKVADLGTGIAPQVSIAAYRIVQEALTNAHRYGDGKASVLVVRDRDARDDVRIEVANMHGARRRASSPGGGNGLVGMRERAESVGGSVDIRDGDPFWVVALLPAAGRES